jgi:hypothetical protein
MLAQFGGANLSWRHPTGQHLNSWRVLALSNQQGSGVVKPLKKGENSSSDKAKQVLSTFTNF